MIIKKFNKQKDTARNGNSTAVVAQGGSGGQASSSDHASTADFATEADHASTADVAQNLAENSTDWTTMALRFLSKTAADTAAGLITFLAGLRAKVVSYFEQGVEFGDYQTGALGTGGAVLIDQGGNSVAEFDYLTVRKAASFREISIKELRHVGGEIVLSAAAMKCSKVVQLDSNMQTLLQVEGQPLQAASYYKCYFDTDDADGVQKVFQEFVVGDLARCQTFGTTSGSDGYTSTRYYWRKVVAVGEDYIVLSNISSEMDSGSTSAPAVGDNIVQLGYTGSDKAYRQSAIILSATDVDAPSMKFYQGINSFSLPSPVKDEGYDPTTGVFHSNVYGNFYAGDANGHISYNSQTHEFEVKGKVQMNSSSTFNGSALSGILDQMDSAIADAADAADAAGEAAGDAQDAAAAAQQSVNNLSTGVENLVVNGGFTGLYSSESVEDLTDVDADTQVFSEPFGRWTTHSGCTIVSAVASATGVACKLQSGRLEQAIARGIKSGEKYTFSLRGIAAGTVTVSIGGVSQSLTVAAGSRSGFKFTASSTTATLVITGSATITEILLVQGSITINDWVPSPEDNNKYLAYYKNLAYLMEAMGDASTTTLGGLILTQMIRVGNYANQVMTQETGGMSGSNVSSDSPFLWGGGTMQQALTTIAAYANDPTYQPTSSELASMAKFVVTHGGRAILQDIILRGIVYASGGKFFGEEGMFRIELDADSRKISIFGPSSLTGTAGNLEPAPGATEFEYLTIGEFKSIPSGSGWTTYPLIQFHYPSPTGPVINTVIDPFGISFSTTINGVTTPGNSYSWNGFSLESSTVVLNNLPTSAADCVIGQMYADNGVLKIRTS